MAYPTTPKFAWGALFANDWILPGPVDGPQPDHAFPGGDGSVAEAGSGARDRWVDRTDHDIEISVRLVPQLDTASGITGYSTAATGVYQALLWLDAQNIGRYYADKDGVAFHNIYLLDYEVSFEDGGAFRRVRMWLRDADGLPFTDVY